MSESHVRLNRKMVRWGVSALVASALLVSAAGSSGWPSADGAKGPGLLLQVSAAEASVFSDVTTHWGRASIEWAVKQGVVDGFADGTFQPDKLVSEAEFVTMLLRAYVGSSAIADQPNAPWYAKYYAYAGEMHWPVDEARANTPYKRGLAARLLAASQGQDLGEAGAIGYLLDNGLAQGKTSGTVEGFGAGDTLTRAESVQFIRNLKSKAQYISGLPAPVQSFAVRGVAIGDSVSSVQAKLGAPDRRDASEYGFEWYIYNADYANYAQIGIMDGKVVGLYTNSSRWTTSKEGVQPGAASRDVVKTFGKPLDSITKGFTRYLINSPGVEEGMYEIDGSYVTFYYDTHEGSAIEAIQVIAKETEEAKKDYYGTPSEQLRTAYELEAFDLANAARVKRGLKPYKWDDQVAGTARKHSEDMAVNQYFDHKSPSGQNLGARLDADAVNYESAAENIAAGQPNAITAHAGWLNSTTGHRKSLLSDLERLGVGVYFGGKMHVYYTENFISPMN
ncbi:CAP-associated domain-containing protein [Paenibacillus sp. GCM10012303]|uniref:CAP-associated domain-containing protein n=1 Tax=Paenibacillus sp. GCM10012303 TaxID=3317340 RepID=UPI0036080A30